MNVPFKIGVRAEYKLIRMKAVTDEHGNRVPGPVMEETPWTKNILTLNYFNDALAISTLRVRGISVGAGTTAAAEGQSTLVSFIAATTSRQSYAATFNATVSPRSVTKEFRYRFGEGVAAGNVAEVGMFTTNSSGTTSATLLSSRARIVDGLGAPTTVTVLSDEFLDVIWRCTWYVPEDVTGTCNISIDGVPTSFNWTIRATSLQAGGNSWWEDETIGVYFNSSYVGTSPGLGCQATTESTLRTYTDIGNGTEAAGQQISSITQDAYTPNSKNRTFRFVWGLTQANITIRSFIIQCWVNIPAMMAFGRFQILLNNPITKVNTKTFTLILNMAMDNV